MKNITLNALVIAAIGIAAFFGARSIIMGGTYMINIISVMIIFLGIASIVSSAGVSSTSCWSPMISATIISVMVALSCFNVFIFATNIKRGTVSDLGGALFSIVFSVVAVMSFYDLAVKTTGIKPWKIAWCYLLEATVIIIPLFACTRY